MNEVDRELVPGFPPGGSRYGEPAEAGELKYCDSIWPPALPFAPSLPPSCMLPPVFCRLSLPPFLPALFLCTEIDDRPVCVGEIDRALLASREAEVAATSALFFREKGFGVFGPSGGGALGFPLLVF